LADGQARVFGLHLKARFSKWSESQRAYEIRALLEGIKQHQHGFHVLVGDFNTLAPGELLDVRRMPHWIRALVWLSGRDIQRETIQIMLDARYVDGYRHLYAHDKGYTFPVWDPHLRLDYIFLPAQFAGQLKSCRVINDLAEVDRASDHYPLLAELELE
jgi:exodeoxyribonuclease-3